MSAATFSQEIFQLSDAAVMHTYGRVKVAFVRGQGAKLWDADGREYLDLLTGLAVNSLGHGHPRIRQAILEAADTLIHTSNLYYIEPQARLAARLKEITGFDRTFFCNSGAEANEAAIKLARRYHRKVGSAQRYEIVTALGSFHGRTLATVAATGQPKYHEGFEPLPEGFKYVPLNDLKALGDAVTEKTAAVMLEPIQGEGGVNPCTDEYLKYARDLCNERGALLILDEVQTGVGRTGTFLAAEHYGIRADICTLAKALGGGVPIGATLATERVSIGFEPGSHASTFGGNFLATRAALAVLDALYSDGVLEASRRAASTFNEALDALAERHPAVVSGRRGKGLMIGVELNVPGGQVYEACLARGLLVNVIGNKVLRLLPPLVISDDEIRQAIAILDEVFEECASACQSSTG